MVDSDCEKSLKETVIEHPYLAGNFAPVTKELPLTKCDFTGTIPSCLAGGEYVRNGGNPLKNDDLAREAHWFDGDGMLSGVLFRRVEDSIVPEFVNAFILTDVLLSSMSSPHMLWPLLPSISSLTNPLTHLPYIIWKTMRAIFLVILSHLPGSKFAVKKISAANTGILYHDGRALATCESGPPMRVLLPGFETVGWFNGVIAEGEPATELNPHADAGKYGGDNPYVGWMREWTTAHPRVDPKTNELISFHSSFIPPFIRYSVVPDTSVSDAKPMFNVPVRGVASAKMMHDFGVSPTHTVILDLPLSLDPMNWLKNKSMVDFDPRGVSRFGIFPRHKPEAVRWFQEPHACCIFHTANTWDDIDPTTGEVTAVNMLCCRMNSARLVFSAGNLESPASALPLDGVADVDQLYYHRFSLKDTDVNKISHSFPLSAIPFEFPSISPKASMRFSRYIYGCSLYADTFSTALGRAAKIDCLVKMDAQSLLALAAGNDLQHDTPVDIRGIPQILAEDREDDNIKIFRLPDGFYAQEMSFVPNEGAVDEDDGYLLTYVFNENEGLDPSTGQVKPDAKGELWVIDARSMKHVIAKVHLPQRVPYGLHGTWINESQIMKQRPVESIRQFIEDPMLTSDKLSPNTSQGLLPTLLEYWYGFWWSIRTYCEIALAR